MRAAIRIALLFGIAPAVALGLPGPWPWSLRLNTSASLPLGLYGLERLRKPARGGFVLACPPEAAAWMAFERGYLRRGNCPGGVAPLGKIVVGVAGDVVVLDADGLRVNGCAVPTSSVQAKDLGGRPLAHAPFGRRRLGAGEVWLFSPHPRSFDSRYFGPVPGSQLLGTLMPLWVSSIRTGGGSSSALRALSGPRCFAALGRGAIQNVETTI